ncbi:hypothetical protein ABVT39_019422 [Epinephelus coioides]
MDTHIILTQNLNISQPRDDEAMSVHTHTSTPSRGSNKSSASMATVNARARAEAAQARAAFAQKEIEMKVKQAQLKVEETHLEATLDALHQQCDAEAALAEVNVYEAVASEMEQGRISGDLYQTFNNSERTSEYVKDQIYQKFEITPREDMKPLEVPVSSTYFQLKQDIDMFDPGITPYISLPQSHGNDGVPQPSQGFKIACFPQTAIFNYNFAIWWENKRDYSLKMSSSGVDKRKNSGEMSICNTARLASDTTWLASSKSGVSCNVLMDNCHDYSTRDELKISVMDEEEFPILPVTPSKPHPSKKEKPNTDNPPNFVSMLAQLIKPRSDKLESLLQDNKTEIADLKKKVHTIYEDFNSVKAIRKRKSALISWRQESQI